MQVRHALPDNVQGVRIEEHELRGKERVVCLPMWPGGACAAYTGVASKELIEIIGMNPEELGSGVLPFDVIEDGKVTSRLVCDAIFIDAFDQETGLPTQITLMQANHNKLVRGVYKLENLVSPSVTCIIAGLDE